MVAMSDFQLYDGILHLALLVPCCVSAPHTQTDTRAGRWHGYSCYTIRGVFYLRGGDHTCGWKPCRLYSLSNFPDCPHQTKAVNLCVWPGPELKPNVEPGSILSHSAKRQRGTTRHWVESRRKWSFLHKKMSGTSGNVWAGRVSLKLWGEQRKFPHVGAPRHVWKCFDPVAVCWVPPINRRDDVHP